MIKRDSLKDFIFYLRKLIKCEDEFITKADVARIATVILHFISSKENISEIIDKIEEKKEE